MDFVFHNVEIVSLGVSLPDLELTSTDLERELSPLYERLKLVPGRLELLTGIRARRFFPLRTLPSDIAIAAAKDCLGKASVSQDTIDCLIFSSVCRNFVEPATATVVHEALKLSPSCLLFDLSNACLGWLNGILLAGSLLEHGSARSALIVSGENAHALVHSTIERLNHDNELTRQSLKSSIASLTLGSGGVALLLRRNDTGHRLMGGVFESATAHHALCIGGSDPGESTVRQISMRTESEKMLEEGVELAKTTWQKTRHLLEWSPDSVSHYFTHQVGAAHRRRLFEKLELDRSKEFSTFEFLGNTGSAALGITWSLAEKQGRLIPQDRVVAMGIGSGLVCGMLGVVW